MSTIEETPPAKTRGPQVSAGLKDAVLGALHDHADPTTGRVTITNPELHRLLGYSVRSIQQALHDFRVVGLISSQGYDAGEQYDVRRRIYVNR